MTGACLAAVLALSAHGAVIQIAARPPGALHATPQAAWSAAVDPALARLPQRWGDAPLAPVLRALELKGLTPEAYAAMSPALRAEAAEAAAREVAAEAALEAASLLRQAAKADPAAPEFEVLAAKLAWLAGPLAGFVPEDRRQALAAAAQDAKAKLGAAKAARLEEALARVALGLGRTPDLPATPVEAAAAALTTPPARLLTPGVARLRAQSDRFARPVPPPSDGRAFRAKVEVLKARVAVRRAFARRVYRPLLERFRDVMTHAGELWRKYMTGRPLDKHDWRWSVVEGLHKHGDFRGSFGHPVHDGTPEVMSGLIFPQDALAAIKGRTRRLGNIELNAQLGISGMSFPQLSDQSHLSLLYIHLKLAQQGLRGLYNTGEGGPGLLLGLLDDDPEAVKAWIIDWNVANGQFEKGSWREAAVVAQVDALMKTRDRLFDLFSPNDLKKAQIVAQFGSAFNGARAEGGRADFDKLRLVAANPAVAMVQYKVKQAAKRGAKVDPKKVDDIVAAFRDIRRNQPFKSPEVAPDLDSVESIAALIKATKLVTGKPVSLKFGIGDAADLLAFLEALRDLDALPDHIQLDGRGDDFSPGSGNAPPGANTSLPAREAIIVADAVLKKLAIRDRVLLDATGDILQPIDAVEALALGADLVSAGRGWMGMGLGCAKVKACAEGSCPYGIASKMDSTVGLSFDANKVAPKGYAAAANWHKVYAQTLAEAGLTDWTQARRTLGLDSRTGRIRIKDGVKTVPLDRFYDPRYVTDLLRGALTQREVDRLVFGR